MSRNSERASKRAKGVETQTFFSADLVEAPHADASVSGKVEKKRKLYTGVIYSSLVAMIVFAVVSLGLYSTVNDLSTKQFPAQVTIDTPGKHAAIRAVEGWLAGDPSPLPTGYILSWDGATTQQEERTFLDKNGKSQYQIGIELDRFTLATTSGAIFTTEVQVGFGAASGTGVIGAPTLMPVAPSDPGGFASQTGWIGTMPGSSNQSIEDAVKSWVTSFTSGDPAALRLAVGDGRSNISYIPMTGIQETGAVDIKQAAVFPADKSLPTDQWVANPSVAVVRVSFTVAWPGQLNSSRSNVTGLGRLTYDLLVEKADTSAPKIVAWGSAGTGASLKAYQNAVSGNVTTDKLSTGSTTPTAPTPNPTPTPSASSNPKPTVTPSPSMSPSQTGAPLDSNSNSTGSNNG
jgi:hypothetical protein